jgi:regulator of sirC expression with transglutaminase-like and TPR domain
VLPEKEIQALFRLLDDPDDEVFNMVADKLLHCGKEIIPGLEYLWETTENNDVQDRITQLIHRVQFQDIRTELKVWAAAANPELLRGAILIAKYQYPELNIPFLLTQFDKIRRNLWLELNNYLTPLEKVDVFNGILYNYYKLKGHELTEQVPERFYINRVLESKNGNSYTLGILYVALSELLDIPIFATAVPRQFLLAYVDNLQHFYTLDNASKRQNSFYVDPQNGMVYTQHDVEVYLQRLNLDAKDDRYYAPLSNREIILRLLKELRRCYQSNSLDEKAEEMEVLMAIVEAPSDDE